MGFDWLVIAGHTDSRGAHAHNQALSERRARAVREFFTTYGVPADRVVVHAYGETDPVATNATESGRAQNRRVDVWAYFVDESPSPRTQWWRECFSDPAGAHGHTLRAVSADEYGRRSRLEKRRQLENEYNSYAITQEARYGRLRSSSGGGTWQRSIVVHRGQTVRHTQSDVDHGAVRVVCRRGRVRVTLSTSVWTESAAQATVELSAGEAWAGEFRERNERLDQDNTVAIQGLSESTVDVQMISYDYTPRGAGGEILERAR